MALGLKSGAALARRAANARGKMARKSVDVFIDATSVEMALIARGRTVRQKRLQLDHESELAEILTGGLVQLLGQTEEKASSAWRMFRISTKVHVRLLFDSAIVGAKELHGLPPLANSRLVQSLVIHETSRFFALPDQAFLVGVSISQDGRVFAALYDATLVSESIAAVDAVGGDVIEIAAVNGFVNCIADGAEPSATSVAQVPLRDVKRERAQLQPVGRAVYVIAAFFVMLGVVVPGTLRSIQVTSLERQVAELTAGDIRGSGRLDSLLTTRRQFAELAEMNSTRRSMSWLLSKLAATIPRDVRVLRLRVDSLGGDLTIAGSEIRTAIKNLDSAPEFTGVALIGPVESSAGQSNGTDVRVRLRFQFHRHGP